MKDRDKRNGLLRRHRALGALGIKPLDCLQDSRRPHHEHPPEGPQRFGPGAHDVPYGQGVSDVKGILDELKRQGFNGNISIEYEYQQENPLPNVTKCIEFLKQYGGAQ